MASPALISGGGLVVGIDYGTTFTGLSFCEVSDTSAADPDIQLVDNWPNSNGNIATTEKVPSEIEFSRPQPRWGGLIPSNVQRHMWTKLQLDPRHISEAERIRTELMRSTSSNVWDPVDIVAQFLAHVRKHLFKNLDEQYGPDLWRTLPMVLVVTVPAVWSDAAKDRTLQAFRQAGFNQADTPQLTKTMTVTEPEAAALYTIKNLQGSIRDKQLAVGDGFVVCDMGGGTADLISYKVTGINPTVVKEVTVGSGDQCGGSFVELGFLRWLERKLGVQNFQEIAGTRAENLSRTSMPAKLGRMVRDFVSSLKNTFQETEEDSIRLPHVLSHLTDASKGISEGEIHIKSSDLVEIFEYPLERTKELLLEQFRRAKKSGLASMRYVFLVGGFARSPYMHAQLSKFIHEKSKALVMKPPHPWSAIVRGAAAKGLEQFQLRADIPNLIQARKCRRHYGTDYSTLFVEGKHDEDDSFVCRFTGEKRANYRVDWSISKGQDLSSADSNHGCVSLHSSFWMDQSKELIVELFATDRDSAPERSIDDGVYTVAELEVDLSKVPIRKFRKRRNLTGEAYLELSYEVHLSIQSVIEYSVQVDGEKYGSVTATYT